MSGPVVEVLPPPVHRWLGKEYAKSVRGKKWYPQTQPQFDALESEADILLMTGTVGSLKDLAITTAIPTPAGWSTMAAIQVGDMVFDDLGHPCSVTGISPIYMGNQVYEIEFDDGTVVRAGKDHLWLTMNLAERDQSHRGTERFRANRRLTRSDKGGKGIKFVPPQPQTWKIGDDLIVGSVKTTAEIATSVTSRHGKYLNHSIATAKALDLPERSDLPIEPYLLGCWLGDGTASSGNLTIGTEDQHDFIFQLRMCGHELVANQDPLRYNVIGLHRAVRLAGLKRNKHIPAAYLRASRCQRLALLQGLMDTDGTASRRAGCVFYNTNLIMVRQVRELILSLGVKASIGSWTAKVNGKDCGLCYGISFSAPFGVFRLGRKLALQILGTRLVNWRHYIKRVTEVATEPTKCITVDSPSRLYLCSESFIPTHNTSTMLVDGIQDKDSPKMNTYFFRRTYPAMEDAMRQASELFPQLGFRSVDSHGGFTRTWRTPIGGTFAFRQLMNKKDLDNNWGKEMSTILFDESTHWEEEYIRVIMTRNRSSDPDMRLRVRMGTNPGNIGRTWHMNMFFNGVCPHCEPNKAPPQGQLQWDGRWPTAGTKLNDPISGQRLSIAYLLGNVHEHDLFKPDYLARLRMQSPALAAALEAGCWAAFEGQYFDCWDRDRMVVPLQSIPQEYYQVFWTGNDYGFRGSIATSGLFTRAPNGVIYMIAEHPADVRDPRQNVRQFAQSVYEKFAKKEMGQEQARHIEAMYLGPDSWNDRGDEHTLAGQMNDVLEPHGLEFIKANNDRAGGAQLFWSMLANDEFKIADTCVNTIAAIESRLHDEDEPVKVMKVIGDPLDCVYDACRYGLYSFMEAQGKPSEKRIEDRMKQIMKQPGDMTATTALLRYHKIKKEEEQDDDQPVYVGGNIRRRMQQAKKR